MLLVLRNACRAKWIMPCKVLAANRGSQRSLAQAPFLRDLIHIGRSGQIFRLALPYISSSIVFPETFLLRNFGSRSSVSERASASASSSVRTEK